MIWNSVGVLKEVLLCKPDHWEILPLSDLARNNMDNGTVINKEAAFEQHAEFTQAWEENGVKVVWVEPNPKQKWQTVTRDWGIMMNAGVLIGKFRYYERKGEEINAIKCFKENNYPIIGQIQTGAFEGGDCWFLDEHTLAVGMGNRTTHTGVEESSGILSEYDIEIIPVEMYSRWNHLDMNFSMLTDKLAIGTSAALPDFFLGVLKGKGIEFVDFSEELVAGTCYLNLVPLGNDKVMSFKDNKINDKLRALGFEVIDPAFDQFTISGAGPHCMSHDITREKHLYSK